MLYCVTSAPSIFQSVMDKLLNGIPSVQCYLDDIILCSESVNEHIELLDNVLSRLVQAGVRVNNVCLVSFLWSIWDTVMMSIEFIQQKRRCEQLRRLQTFLCERVKIISWTSKLLWEVFT